MWLCLIAGVSDLIPENKYSLPERALPASNKASRISLISPAVALRVSSFAELVDCDMTSVFALSRNSLILINSISERSNQEMESARFARRWRCLEMLVTMS